MSFLQSVDWPTIGLVLGGTLLATLLRCGFAEVGLTLRMLARVLVQPGFDADPARAKLAVQIQDLRKDGLIRAHHFQIGDREFDEASKAMIGERSVAALLAAHERHKTRRAVRGQVAARTLAMAAELAPVFGLFGTLLSLGMLPAAGVSRSGYMAAIGMAVHATMVGLLAANLLFAPLARLIERRLAAEEVERQALFEWMALQLAVSEPHLREGQGHAGHEPRAAQVHRFSAG
ncbi:MAG: MotA/TolQ/ExbB proton channel family protein [Sphingomonadales bacterium]|nr:MotA/TolQ/ExbB proton channel family protein [Sphingomonadales bacterium]